MSTKKASLAELMGRAGANAASSGLRLSQLPEILGDAMPELPKNAVGRHRLIRALQQRFGANFRSLPGVRNLVTEFDGEISFAEKLEHMRQIKPRGKHG